MSTVLKRIVLFDVPLYYFQYPLCFGPRDRYLKDFSFWLALLLWKRGFFKGFAQTFHFHYFCSTAFAAFVIDFKKLTSLFLWAAFSFQCTVGAVSEDDRTHTAELWLFFKTLPPRSKRNTSLYSVLGNKILKARVFHGNSAKRLKTNPTTWKQGWRSAKSIPGPVKIFRGGELAVLFIKTMLKGQMGLGAVRDIYISSLVTHSLSLNAIEAMRHFKQAIWLP